MFLHHLDGRYPLGVEQILLAIARENPKVQSHPTPEVLFSDLGASTLNFTLRFWTDTIIDLRIASEMRHEIIRRFDEHKLAIAFPQLDVHLVPAEPASPPTLSK